MSDLIDCKWCNGRGRYRTTSPGAEHIWPDKIETCEACEGKGKATQEKLDAYAKWIDEYHAAIRKAKGFKD